ncbi:cortical cell-delineating protein-like [Oryza brachyantha]|uniref:Bifunctional inhibitor/plant lipid transfer protein/seed storage helical domain-containing protein n=1 Tax=Oryza brachyantha TaxID=4533 RepID=J3N1A9_ORYBR|nr:cortical cell-delineating protein-like [Oryza brachyantha]
MAPKSAAFLALVITMSFLSLEVVHGCGDTSCSNPSPPPPAVPSPSGGTCPINALDLAVCADVLQYVLRITTNAPSSQCCPLLARLVDLDAAVCLCTAIKANVLGVVAVDVPLDITLVLNYCNKTCPPGFTCPL